MYFHPCHCRGNFTSKAALPVQILSPLPPVEGYRRECLFLWGHYTHPLSVNQWRKERNTSLNKNSLFALHRQHKHIYRAACSLQSGTKIQKGQGCLGLFEVFQHKKTLAALPGRINKGINILAGQLAVWHCVTFSLPLVSSAVVNTAVNLVYVVILDKVVTMVTVVTVVIRIMIQLCVLHWPLLKGGHKKEIWGLYEETLHGSMTDRLMWWTPCDSYHDITPFVSNRHEQSSENIRENKMLKLDATAAQGQNKNR